MFFIEFWFSFRDKVVVICWRDVCFKLLLIFFGCFDLEYGIVDEEKNWFKFYSVGKLE